MILAVINNIVDFVYLQLRLDVQELKSLVSLATRPKVKDILSLDLRKVETEVIKLQEQLSKEAEQQKAGSSTAGAVVTGAARCYDVKITNFGKLSRPLLLKE